MAKRIGILTSGGDAPGMNAAVRTLVRAALSFDMEPFGIYRGYHGLINNEIERLTSQSVSGIIQRGGTVLKSARSKEFMTPAGVEQAVNNLKEHGIDGVVVIGGDGSFRGALELAKHDIQVIGIPATIDNDIPCTDYSIGFDTAVNTVMDAVNKIRDTASSHERVYIVEVMGRHCGYLALYSGLACGADSILIPEAKYDLEDVCARIKRAYEVGKGHNIVMLAEGVGLNLKPPVENISFTIGKQIEEYTGYETRIVILGHIQRGGSPTVNDRILASRLAYQAVRLIAQGQSGKMVGQIEKQIRAFDLDYALAQTKSIDMEYYHLAEILSTL
ncbi:MAG: 6-phosphofructokinase [Candidatus Wallacebacter cryptica]|jgi:6-phosphofructokinase 1|nr:6-phosphofructokinase [Bacillota bacterium]